MIVDCDSCEVRGRACGECAIGVLLGMPAVPEEGDGGVAAEPAEPAGAGWGLPSGAPPVQLAAAERRALAVLADQGLLPRLRAVPRRTRPVTGIGGGATDRRDAV